MTDTPNWQALLERTRTEADKSFVTEYIDTLCHEDTLSDGVKVRLLANSVGDSPVNQAKVFAHKDFVDLLLDSTGVAPMILYNLCVGNPEIAEYLISHEDALVELLARDKTYALSMMGVLDQELDEIPLSLGRKLTVDKGMLEGIMLNEKLAHDQYILDNLDKIMTAAETYTEYSPVVDAITAISFNESFTLESARHIEPRKSVAFAMLLANLTMKTGEVELVLAHWPSAIDLVLDLFHEADSIEDEEVERIPSFAAYFLRNVARDPELAQQLWDKDIARVLEYITDNDDDPVLSLQLAGHLAAVRFDPDLVEDILESEVRQESPQEHMLACTRIGEGLLADPELAAANKELIEQLETCIVECLQQTPASLPMTLPFWVKGTRALAQLSPYVPVNIEEVFSEELPDSEAVRANLAAVVRSSRAEMLE